MKNLVYKYILFDLDGTISESCEGIRASLEYAINTLKKPMPNLDDYTLYIGPPLIDTFLNLCHFSEDEAKQGVDIYRQYYDSVGKYKNKLYNGIEQMLKYLKTTDSKIAICSSKYEKFSEEIVEILKVTKYFDAVCGSTLDKSRKDKKDLIPYAVKKLGGNFAEEKDNVVMIGDTHFDAKGARLCGVDFVGVEYGYGTVSSMKAEGATQFVKSADELLKFLNK